MAQRRMILRSIWSDFDFTSLHPTERLLYLALTANADDQGRMQAEPCLVRSVCFPLERIGLKRIAAGLDAIARLGWITIYEAGGASYLQIRRWWMIQRLQWAQPSSFPPPPGWTDHTRFQQGKRIIVRCWPPSDGERFGGDPLPDARPAAEEPPVAPPEDVAAEPPVEPDGDPLQVDVADDPAGALPGQLASDSAGGINQLKTKIKNKNRNRRGKKKNMAPPAPPPLSPPRARENSSDGKSQSPALLLLHQAYQRGAGYEVSSALPPARSRDELQRIADDGHSPDDVEYCTSWLRTDDWWSDKVIPIRYLADALPEWIRQGRPTWVTKRTRGGRRCDIDPSEVTPQQIAAIRRSLKSAAISRQETRDDFDFALGL